MTLSNSAPSRKMVGKGEPVFTEHLLQEKHMERENERESRCMFSFGLAEYVSFLSLTEALNPCVLGLAVCFCDIQAAPYMQHLPHSVHVCRLEL